MDLIEVLNQYRENPPVSESKKPNTAFNPSAGSVTFKDPKTGIIKTKGTCLRQEYYRRQNLPVNTTISAKQSRIMEMGNLISNMIVEDAKRNGIYVADETSFYDEVNNVSGRIDLIVKDPYLSKPMEKPSVDQLVIIEIKSMGGYYQVKGPMVSTKDTPLLPKIEHLIQIMLYANYFMRYGVNKYVLLYCNRENMELVDHKILIENGYPTIVNKNGITPMPHITMENILSRFKTLEKHLENKTVPERDYVLQYSNSRIVKELDAGNLSATDSAIVTKRMQARGTITDTQEPLLTKGDWECAYCPFIETCWASAPKPAIEDDNPATFEGIIV